MTSSTNLSSFSLRRLGTSSILVLASIFFIGSSVSSFKSTVFSIFLLLISVLISSLSFSSDFSSSLLKMLVYSELSSSLSFIIADDSSSLTVSTSSSFSSSFSLSSSSMSSSAISTVFSSFSSTFGSSISSSVCSSDFFNKSSKLTPSSTSVSISSILGINESKPLPNPEFCFFCHINPFSPFLINLIKLFI